MKVNLSLGVGSHQEFVAMVSLLPAQAIWDYQGHSWAKARAMSSNVRFRIKTPSTLGKQVMQWKHCGFRIDWISKQNGLKRDLESYFVLAKQCAMGVGEATCTHN
jgi:hypothetical protein